MPPPNPSAVYRGVKALSDFFRGVKSPAVAKAPGWIGRGFTKFGRWGADVVRAGKGEANLANYHTEGLGKYWEASTLGEKAGFVTGTGLGYLAAPSAIAGAYNWMRADKPEPDKPRMDAHGNLLKGHDEDAVKARQKFMQTNMLGANKFSVDLYKSMRSQTPWVDAAIAEMGEDTYREFRDAVAQGADPQALHNALVSAYTRVAHESELKDIGNKPYILPGLYSRDGRKRSVMVMNPVKDKAGQQSFGLMDFEAEPNGNR